MVTPKRANQTRRPSNSAQKFSALRKEYRASRLSEASLSSSPIVQFGLWLDEAICAGETEPNTMVLATSDTRGRPSLRLVLLKHFDKDGFIFFTNYQSRKAKEIETNKHVALLFAWPRHERQVRIEGTAKRTSRAISEQYFARRPRESQIGSAISPQSSTIPNRTFLERRFALLDRECANSEIACPDHWGGYIITPARFEFWQGGEHRLHDRIEYFLKKGRWKKQRLAP